MNAALAELDQLQPPSEDGAISRALTDLDAKIDAWTTAVAQAHDRIASDVDGITELLEETAAAEARLAGAAEQAATHENSSAAEADVDEAQQDVETAEVEADADADIEELVADEEADAVQAFDAENVDTFDESPASADVEEAMVAETAVEEEDVPLFDASSFPARNADEDDATAGATVEETGDVIETMLAEFPPDVAERLKIMHATDENRRSMADIISGYKAEMQDADELLADMDPEAAQAIRVQYRLFNGRKSIRELIDAYQPSNEQQIKAGRKKKSWWRG